MCHRRSRVVTGFPVASKNPRIQLVVDTVGTPNNFGSSGNCGVNDRRRMQARALHPRRLRNHGPLRKTRPPPCFVCSSLCRAGYFRTISSNVQANAGATRSRSSCGWLRRAEAAPVGNHNLHTISGNPPFPRHPRCCSRPAAFTRRRRQRKGERLEVTAEDADECGFPPPPSPPPPNSFWLLRGHSISIGAD